MEPRQNILKIENDCGYVRICAPMVRYSKLPFRNLVRLYDVDVAFTPMILADVFRNSQLSRDSEFTTNELDSPVIVQFAANNGKDAADAAELVAKYSNGVDINCGCPQPWAIQEQIGSFLLRKPELIADIVTQVKCRTSSVKLEDGSSFPCSVKIRIDSDIKKSVELCKRAEMAKCDFITVHGRTRQQRNSNAVNHEAIAIIKSNLSIPVMFNGGINTLEEANEMIKLTKTDGVMVAQGLLNNPAMFSGFEKTPIEAVQKFIELSLENGTNHYIFHHHLMHMLHGSLTKQQKKVFNQLPSIAAVLDYLENFLGISWKEDLEHQPLNPPK
jgi:tRNA-dihydrouridine synthase 4